MPIEATLTRTLDIRFIDARAIANEAKLNLGISGYPSQQEEAMLVDEAIRIFDQSPTAMKSSMRRLRDHLDACKSSSDLFSRSNMDNDESYSESSDDFARKRTSVMSMFSRRSR